MFIDLEAIKQFLGTDEKFIAVLIDKYVQDMPEEAKKLKASAARKNWDEVKAMSHKMLSGTKIFNIKVLTSILQNIEKFSEKRTNLGRIPSLIEEFETSGEKILKEMKKLRSELLLRPLDGRH